MNTGQWFLLMFRIKPQTLSRQSGPCPPRLSSYWCPDVQPSFLHLPDQGPGEISSLRAFALSLASAWMALPPLHNSVSFFSSDSSSGVPSSEKAPYPSTHHTQSPPKLLRGNCSSQPIMTSFISTFTCLVSIALSRMEAAGRCSDLRNEVAGRVIV